MANYDPATLEVERDWYRRQRITTDFGCLEWRYAPAGTVEIVDIVVDNEHRREGIGRHLLAELVRRVHAHATTIYAFTRRTNYIAIAWYHAMGFRLVSVPLPFYEDDERRAMLCVFTIPDFED